MGQFYNLNIAVYRIESLTHCVFIYQTITWGNAGWLFIGHYNQILVKFESKYVNFVQENQVEKYLLHNVFRVVLA